MKASHHLGIITCAALLLAVTLPLLNTKAQQSDSGEAVSATASLDPPTVTPGGQAELKISLSVIPGYHINADRPDDQYLIPTAFTPSPIKGVVWGKPSYPEANYVIESWLPEPLKVFNGNVVIIVPLNVGRNVPSGSLAVGGKLQVQACNSEMCLPPDSIDISAHLTVSGTKDSAAAGDMRATPEVGPISPVMPGKQVSFSEGAEVADFTFTDFTGKTRRLSDFRNRVVLLDFWATWCLPCLADFPHLKQVYERYHSRGFEILGMHSETIGQEEVDSEFIRIGNKRAREIVASRSLTWPQATAESAVPIAEKVFGVKSLPMKVLLDAQGKVVAVIKEGKELDELLARLLAKP